jgi:hypothetical protein
VTGEWNVGGTSSWSSCTTDANGQCDVSKSGILKKTASVTSGVTGVTHESMLFQVTENHPSDRRHHGEETVGRRMAANGAFILWRLLAVQRPSQTAPKRTPRKK